MHAAPVSKRLVCSLLVATATTVAVPRAIHAQAQWMPNGAPICTQANGCEGWGPRLCPDDSGGAFVAWQARRPDLDVDIYATRVLTSGEVDPRWPATGAVACTTQGDTYFTSIASDGFGGAFVVWHDDRGGPFGSRDLYAQHLLASGTRAAGFAEDGNPVCIAPGGQDFCGSIADGAGGAYFAWVDSRRGGPLEDVYVQHLDSAGGRISGWPEDGLPACSGDWQSGAPYLVGLGAEGLLVFWSDSRPGGRGVYAQRMQPNGELAPGWPVNGIRIVDRPDSTSLWTAVSDHQGGAYVGFLASLETGFDLRAVRILPDGSPAPGWSVSGVLICSAPDARYLNAADADTSGVIFAWDDYRGTASQPYAIKLLPDGTRGPGWNENGNLMSDLTGYVLANAVVMDETGGAMLTIDQCCYTGHVQRVTREGVPALGWPLSGVPVADAPSLDQSNMRATTDARGGIIVVWEDYRDGYMSQLYVQRFSGDGPTPALLSLLSADATPERVTLTWQRTSGDVPEGTVDRRSASEEWRALSSVTFDASGRLSYEDRAVTPGERYAYRLRWREDGMDHASAETWVDVPRELALALDGAVPNPVTGDLRVAFTLASAERATLDVLDLAGRRVASREVGSLGPGRHLLPLELSPRPAPGVYWLRLSHGQALLRRKIVLNR